MLTDRQQQIIEASIELIDQKGIQGFTIKNLSKEIGISEPGIYRHFDSKVMILSTILDTFKQGMNAYHQRKQKEETVSAEEQIMEFFSMVFMMFSLNPALVSVIFAEEIFQNEPALTEKVLEIQEDNEKIIMAMLKSVALNHKLKSTDPELLTTLLFGSVRLLVRKWKMGNYDFDLADKGKTLIHTILKMLS
ncbi:transcriptional regulator, TetR family [Saccharicrinis carchari]|uniref:Transcriptional regulator, TetR family n=1 Tax=Saccharicrinis carchari TaxID=1168039 RepID=A0A521AWL8_SACCC|nr:TetR/AcrR family transcriptional regulator [Saccharicrinis carchari]SMO39228.1 transcriptional regulator, TetR family [Saccharicrinis carchari]